MRPPCPPAVYLRGSLVIDHPVILDALPPASSAVRVRVPPAEGLARPPDGSDAGDAHAASSRHRQATPPNPNEEFHPPDRSDLPPKDGPPQRHESGSDGAVRSGESPPTASPGNCVVPKRGTVFLHFSRLGKQHAGCPASHTESARSASTPSNPSRTGYR